MNSTNQPASSKERQFPAWMSLLKICWPQGFAKKNVAWKKSKKEEPLPHNHHKTFAKISNRLCRKPLSPQGKTKLLSPTKPLQTVHQVIFRAAKLAIKANASSQILLQATSEALGKQNALVGLGGALLTSWVTLAGQQNSRVWWFY